MFFRADSGLHRADAGIVATEIAAGAVSLGAVDLSGGQVQLGSGTVGAPALAFKAATDVGAYYDVAGDELRLANSGADIAQLTSAALQTPSGKTLTTAGALNVTGALRVAPEAKKTSNYTAGITDAVIIMEGAALTLTLPASPLNSQRLLVRNDGGGNLTIGRNGNNIDEAAADITVATLKSLELLWDGSTWWTFKGGA